LDKLNFIKESLKESADVKLKIIDECTHDIISISDSLIKVFDKGKKLLLCGNGGSAADCQHIAAEFVVRLNPKLNRPSLPAIALTTDTSFLTAGGNDIGFENVVARGVEGLGNEGDMLIAVSTSGNSPNIINAVLKAKEKGMITVGFLGGSGGKLKALCDLTLLIPSDSTQRIQEGHITSAHIICEIVETSLYGS